VQLKLPKGILNYLHKCSLIETCILVEDVRYLVTATLQVWH